MAFKQVEFFSDDSSYSLTVNVNQFLQGYNTTDWIVQVDYSCVFTANGGIWFTCMVVTELRVDPVQVQRMNNAGTC